MSSSSVRFRIGVAVATVAAAVSPLLAASSARAGVTACPTSPDKCYSFTLTASPAPSVGQASTFTGTVNNLSSKGSGVSIGSMRIALSEPGANPVLTSPSTGTNTIGKSVVGTQSWYDANTLELDSLGLAPGGTLVFTFSGTTLTQGTITATPDARQSNQFNSGGNSFMFTGTAPTVTVGQAASCSTLTTYDAAACGAFSKAAGWTETTGNTTSGGGTSTVTGSLTALPVTVAAGSSPYQQMALQTKLKDEQCLLPGIGPVTCDWSFQLVNRLDSEYSSAGLVTGLVNCSSLCSGLTELLFQKDEATGNVTTLPTCTLGVPGGILSPGQACYESAGTGSFRIRNITSADDWKVMGVAVGG